MLRINLRSRLIIFILLCTVLRASTSGKIIYVDDDATGANDGSSWENAYTYLQDALADAQFAEKPVEIRVAQGIYKPDRGMNQTPGDRKERFRLISGVTLIGGYVGFGGTDPMVRDIHEYETILSGDLNGDDLDVDDPCDLRNEPTRRDNSERIIEGGGLSATDVLDGLTICSAFGPFGSGVDIYQGNPTIVNCTFKGNTAYHDYGGGLLNSSGNPTIINCTFTKNYGELGGGMCSIRSSPTLTGCAFIGNYANYGAGLCNMKDIPKGNSTRDSNSTLIDCTFVDNISRFRGGGIYNGGSDSHLSNCTFSGNSSLLYGAGIYNRGSNHIMIDCTFGENKGGSGGGIYSQDNSSLIVTNCTFRNNIATAVFGGGICNEDANELVLTNCTFSGNTAMRDGGGIFNRRTNSTIKNCILTGNKAYGELIYIGEGGGLYAFGDTILNNCTFYGNWAHEGRAISKYSDSFLRLNNCILWNGGDEIFDLIPNSTTLDISYSNIKNGWEGTDNINEDPLFANPGYWADADDPNIVAEPNDPNAVWIEGDYHLKSEAGRWDSISESWVVDDVTSPCIDAGDPNSPVGNEPEPSGGIINMGAYGGTSEASMSPAGVEQIVYVQWLGHSTVKVWMDDCVIYVDPERVPESLHDATLVCVTHTHGDHYSPSDIAKVSNAETQFIAPPDVIQRYGGGQTIAPGQTIEFDFVNIKAVPSYNTNKSNHPKSNNWVGYIIELAGKRIYVAGDTDLIEEMKSLGDINVAFLPAGGTYTMNATEAAKATGYIKPDLAIPYHWGQNVGTLSDAQRFVELAQSPAMVLTVSEMISSDNWPEYSPLIAHWALDDAEGEIAHESVGENHGTTSGDPTWQPASGKIDGALLLDGIDDYISTDFVLDPADGAFSVFAWIKGGAPYQVIISQADILAGRSTKPGSIWLCVDPLDGKLMTYLGLASAGSPIPPAPPLVSESVITDGQWHHIGFVWDGSYRALYVDGIEIARDTTAQNPLQSATGGLRIGASNYLEAGNFFSGLIDDVRIYNAALTAEQVKEFAN